MRKTALFVALALTAVGCAHAPRVEKAETAVHFASMTVVRDAVRAELLAVTGDRTSGISLDMKLVGAPHYLGVIDYTGTSKTNHEATTPFNNTGVALCGKTLLLQPSTDMYLLPVATNTGTTTSTNGVQLFANERVEVTLENASTGAFCWLAALRVTSSGNLRVWELF